MADVSEAKSKLIADLLKVADTYCAAAVVTRASLSKALFGRGGHLDDLHAGSRDLATGTYERAMRWLAVNWPAEVDWPVGVFRPALEAA